MSTTGKLNLVELIFVQSALENSIEKLETAGESAEALIDALAKIKQQKEAALDKKWEAENL